MNEALVVQRESHIAAPPATVFAFLTDPDKILRWMGTEVTTETHPGGLYLLNGVGDRRRNARGQFREVVPVHRLAYSFGWEGDEAVPPGSSLVEIDLIPPEWRHPPAPDADRPARCGAMHRPRTGLDPLSGQAGGRRRRRRSGARSMVLLRVRVRASHGNCCDGQVDGAPVRQELELDAEPAAGGLV